MKKFVLLIIILLTVMTCGCTKPAVLLSSSELVENEWTIHSERSKVCIDGVEYITINIGHQGYMSPHIKADKLNNPKVVRCEVKNED